MLQMRARAFALRDVFPDVLRGLGIAEEQQDIAQATAAVPAPKPARLGSDAVKAALAASTVIVQESDVVISDAVEGSQEEPQDAPAAETQTEEPSQAEVFQAIWRGELTGLRDKSATDIARRLKEAWLVGDQPEVERIYLEDVSPMENTRLRDKLSRFVDAIGDYLKTEAAENGSCGSVGN